MLLLSTAHILPLLSIVALTVELTAAVSLPIYLGAALSAVFFPSLHLGWNNNSTFASSSSYNLDNIWTDLRNLGDGARSYSEGVIADALKQSEQLKAGVAEFREYAEKALDASTVLLNLAAPDAAFLEKRGDQHTLAFTQSEIVADLEDALQAVAHELQAMFPAPDQAPGHAQRLEVVAIALDKAGAALIGVLAQHGYNETRVSEHWNATLAPAIYGFTVVLGDLAEQHPDLLAALLFRLAPLMLPAPFFLLRPLLRLFGFGPLGPVKGLTVVVLGSTAAWAQRLFFGANVPEGSWFAMLQRAGMKIIFGFFGARK
ncbi:unnamed protein product [Mycena citricolor]|uniref:Uncharacterized protein n=1 Tax=Mycena citricolor TaxID=2018698 RepID=A0AAD2JUT2_9AGAR|nr:unnamed protein product [Mycena citricolor]CAK5263214.1 unnamed protein product [Mycena citricolor]